MALLSLVSAVPSALLALLVSRASTWACLLCFTTYPQRLRLCQMWARVEGPRRVEQCQDAFIAAFQGLSNLQINYEERSHLQDAFTQMAHSLEEEAAAQGLPVMRFYEGSFENAFPAAAEEMKKVILQLKEVQPCVPPCGVQEVARRFLCSKCFSTLCDLPLDCPVRDVTVNRGDQAMFTCVVGFQLPREEITYSWKFAAGGIRTRDVSYFHDVPQARGFLVRIRPVQPKHSGTFSCVIKHDQRPLARLYFFLNVTGPPPRGETELQVAFREVVRWAPRDEEMIEPWRPTLGELLTRPEALTPGNLCLLAAVAALASAMTTMLAWMFFRWYFSGN